jgi:hypothetical protein
LQPRRLYKENQLVEQLEEVIQEIRELMLKSTEEAANKEKLMQEHFNRAPPQHDASWLARWCTFKEGRGITLSFFL